MNDKVCKVFDRIGKRLFVGDKVLVVADQDDIDEYGPSMCGDGMRGVVDSVCNGRIRCYGSSGKHHDIHATLDDSELELTGYSREFLKLN